MGYYFFSVLVRLLFFPGAWPKRCSLNVLPRSGLFNLHCWRAPLAILEGEFSEGTPMLISPTFPSTPIRHPFCFIWSMPIAEQFLSLLYLNLRSTTDLPAPFFLMISELTSANLASFFLSKASGKGMLRYYIPVFSGNVEVGI